MALPLAGDLFRAFTGSDDLEQVLTEFMERMDAGDAEGGHALFTSRARRDFPPSRLEELARGSNRGLFSGFYSLHIEATSVTLATSIDPKLLRGWLARVQGRVVYINGLQGTLDALAQREDGHWRLVRIHVQVPPEKLVEPSSPSEVPPSEQSSEIATLPDDPGLSPVDAP